MKGQLTTCPEKFGAEAERKVLWPGRNDGDDVGPARGRRRSGGMLTPLTPAPPLYAERCGANGRLKGLRKEVMTSSFSSESEDREGPDDESEEPGPDSLMSKDKVLIKTANSLYRFSVTDAALRQGGLSGGTLGDDTRSAILVVSIREGADGHVNETPGLKVGARAVFYLVSHTGMERIITSVVTDLTLIRDGKAWSLSDTSFNPVRESPINMIVPA